MLLPMPSANNEFALYCCDLLSSVGPCVAKRMFGGFGISTDGLTVAILANLGSGDKLWLKADEDTRSQFEMAGCERFTYPVKGVLKSMNYYSAPEEAMESPQLMAPWARMAMGSALKAKARPANKPKVAPKPKPTKPNKPKPLPKLKAG
jgi:DNA transformation protein